MNFNALFNLEIRGIFLHCKTQCLSIVCNGCHDDVYLVAKLSARLAKETGKSRLAAAKDSAPRLLNPCFSTSKHVYVFFIVVGSSCEGKLGPGHSK